MYNSSKSGKIIYNVPTWNFLIQQDADRKLPAALEQIHPTPTMFGYAPAGPTTISYKSQDLWVWGHTSVGILTFKMNLVGGCSLSN